MVQIFIFSLIFGSLFGFLSTLFVKEFPSVRKNAFWLGFFLGPIGMIITVLLYRQTPNGTIGEVARFQGKRDLENESYRLWLSRKYNVKKEDIFNKYASGLELFNSIDDALRHAHNEEQISAAKDLEKKYQRKQFSDNTKQNVSINVAAIFAVLVFIGIVSSR
jgi:hypothetical protein